MTVASSTADSGFATQLAQQYPGATIIGNQQYNIKFFQQYEDIVDGKVISKTEETNRFGGAVLGFPLPEDLPQGKTLRVFKIVDGHIEEQPDLRATDNGYIELVQIEMGQYFLTME